MVIYPLTIVLHIITIQNRKEEEKINTSVFIIRHENHKIPIEEIGNWGGPRDMYM